MRRYRLPGYYRADHSRYLKYFGHAGLLDQRAMVFDGQYDGIRRRYERVTVNHVHGAEERYFRRERMPVIDQWVSVVSVPTVQLDAPTTRQ